MAKGKLKTNENQRFTKYYTTTDDWTTQTKQKTMGVNSGAPEG